jgi:drug/metabolite transporter (DMT)-like permease
MNSAHLLGPTLALLANLFFSAASIFYTKYTRIYGASWVNAFKSTITLFFLLIAVPLFITLEYNDYRSLLGLMLSGFIGLGVGDYFLFKAFFKMGASRTLILFGFQPIFISIFSNILFDQVIEINHYYAMLFMLVCLLLFSYENKQKSGSFALSGLLFALIGVSLDTSGVIISRMSFDLSPGLNPLWGHLIRTSGACLYFTLYQLGYKPLHLLKTFKGLKLIDKKILVLSAFFGTFLSLFFYLTAIKVGHVATITAISVTGPMFAAIFEHVADKRFPSKILLLALISFLIGFSFLI